MYNYNLSVKKLKDSHRTFSKKNAELRWLKNYHEQIQPKLLEHYDARVNAFIKRVSISLARFNKNLRRLKSHSRSRRKLDLRLGILH